jgi:hypothetical protein
VTALEYFRALAEAVRAHRDAELVAQYGRPRVAGGGGGSAPGDPTARAAAETLEAKADMARAQEVIGDGLRVIEGIRRTLGEDFGDVLDARYVDLEPWDLIAMDQGVTRQTARAWHDAALDWFDFKGAAWLREQAR